MKELFFNNNTLFEQAKRRLVGGVNSPARSFAAAAGRQLFLEKGKGSHVFDYEGKEYVDYLMAFGALILGHAHPVVVSCVKQALEAGFCFGTTHAAEVALADIITSTIPCIEKIRFVNSGTEAVMGALRLARGFSGREKIITFANSYHGHADYLLTKAGSGLATLQLPLSKGVPDDFFKHTLSLAYGDIARLEQVFQKYGDDIAAVIVEPVGANYGLIPPDINFLQQLRAITHKHKALLVFDEVVTGFRFLYGSFSKQLGIEPDLICLGKIIGGGLPIGAYGGSSAIMDNLAPLGEVYQASTFGGNPVVMTAGLATLEALALQEKRYEQITDLAKALAEGIGLTIKSHGLEAKLIQYGPMFSLRFQNKQLFRLFYRGLLDEGVLFAPSEFEANFISFAHTEKDVQITIQAVEKAVKALDKALIKSIVSNTSILVVNRRQT